MNSAIQVLWHTQNIVDYFIGGQYDKDKVDLRPNNIVSEELQAVICNLLMGDQEPYNPNSFKNAAKKYIELLDNKEQQDCADFLIQLLELIHNELIG